MTKPKEAPSPALASTDNRTRILEAALNLFAEKGFDGASTRDIASRAGVTQRLLSYYYDSKETLWRTALTEVMEQFRDHLAQRLAGLRGVDPFTVMRLMVREFVILSSHHPQVHSLIFREAGINSPRMEWMIENFIKPSFTEQSELWLQMSPLQERSIDSVSLFFAFLGASAMIFSIAPGVIATSGIDPLDPAFAEKHADAIVAIFCGPDRGAAQR